MTRLFKQKQVAEKFRGELKRAGYFASVFEEPVSPSAGTKRKRSQKRYRVQWDKRETLMNPSPGTRVTTTVKELKRIYSAGKRGLHLKLKVSRPKVKPTKKRNPPKRKAAKKTAKRKNAKRTKRR